jgi:molecular chaperone GrpE
MDDTSPDSPRTGDAEATIDDLRREVADKQDRLLRALAEADNIRRRAQRERDDYVRYANESLIRDLIPILDNFDRAIEAARAGGKAGGDGKAAGGLLEGVELIQREFLKILERAGVTRYSAVGQVFDPKHHEAVARVVSTQQPPDTVVAETLPGYMLNGRVLRPALVAVAGAPDEDAA